MSENQCYHGLSLFFPEFPYMAILFYLSHIKKKDPKTIPKTVKDYERDLQMHYYHTITI